MKTRTDLRTELDDAVVLLSDAIRSDNWLIAWNASHQITALCGKLHGAPFTLSDVNRALDKLGALLEQGGARVHVE